MPFCIGQICSNLSLYNEMLAYSLDGEASQAGMSS